MTVWQRIRVEFEYPVDFTQGVFDPENPTFRQAIAGREPGRRHRFVAVVDAEVARAWPGVGAEIGAYAARHAEALELVAPPLVVPGGETGKNDPRVLERIYDELHRLAMDRHSFVAILGGGALLDVAGYAAATTHRGVRVVRLPTTVLAQADSAVGVKNGINLFGKKNFVGSFSPPYAVINDGRFLETLAERDRRAGMSEAVKVAALRDPAFFAWLDEQAGALAGGDRAALERLIRRSAELHLEHIATSGDPFETGSARPLDFGHWAAHKLESLTEHRLRHGEAVAIGMALDATYAELAGVSQKGVAAAITGVLARLGFTLWDDALASPALMDGLADFREHLGGELTLTMVERIGRGVDVHEVDRDLMARAAASLRP